MKPKVYICDIDGTIADLSHRLHHIQNKPADWDSFFRACVDDLPISDVIETVQALKRDCGYEVILISGRSDAVRSETEVWLEDFGVSRINAAYRTFSERMTCTAGSTSVFMASGAHPRQRRRGEGWTLN